MPSASLRTTFYVSTWAELNDHFTTKTQRSQRLVRTGVSEVVLGVLCAFVVSKKYENNSAHLLINLRVIHECRWATWKVFLNLSGLASRRNPDLKGWRKPCMQGRNSRPPNWKPCEKSLTAFKEHGDSGLSRYDGIWWKPKSSEAVWKKRSSCHSWMCSPEAV